jgi:rare lipoprotein A
LIRATWLIAALLAAPAHAGEFEAAWRRIMVRPPNPGMASWYSDARTSSGERLRPHDRDDLTCASPDEPLGTRLRVCHGGRCIVCRVNDHGPRPHLKRVVDLTPAGFTMLGLRLIDGLGYVTVDRE